MAYSEDVHFVPGSASGALHASHLPGVFPGQPGPNDTQTLSLAEAALQRLYAIVRNRPARVRHVVA